MNKTLSIKDIWGFLLRNILIVILFGALFGAGGYFYAQHKATTTYTAHRNLIISHTQLSGDAYAQTQADIALINTYSNVITDHAITDQVNKQMKHVSGYDYSRTSLPRNITVTTQPNSAWMKISAEASSRKVAEKLADTTALTAKNNLPQYISPAGNVLLLAPAKENSVIANTTPSKKKLTVFAGFVGLFIGLFIVFTWDLFKGRARRHSKSSK